MESTPIAIPRLRVLRIGPVGAPSAAVQLRHLFGKMTAIHDGIGCGRSSAGL